MASDFQRHIERWASVTAFFAHGRRGESNGGNAVRDREGLMQNRLASRMAVVAAAYAEGSAWPRSGSRSCVEPFALPGVESA